MSVRFGDTDLPIFFADMGVSVTFGGVTTKGLIDEPSIIDHMGQRFSGTEAIQRVLTLPFNAFTPMPEPKQTITVDGTNYTIFDRHAMDDGRLVGYGLKG